MNKVYLIWINTLYQWGNNTFTWNEVFEFVKIANDLGNSGIDIFTPKIKEEVRKIATPEQIESFVKIVARMNGKIFSQKKRKSKLTLKDIAVKDIHNTFRTLTVKVKNMNTR